MNIKSLLQRISDNIFVDKYNCILCDRELDKENRYALCLRCMSEFIFIDNSCKKCGKPLNANTDYCIMCQNNSRHFTRAYSVFEYWGKPEKLIYALKFGNKKYIAKYLSAFLADKVMEEEIVADCVVAMPLGEKRKKERGYNQAELLAKPLAERLNLPYNSGLERVKETEMQAKTSGIDRIKNVKDAFLATDSFKKKRVLLIDDVLTTGSTMSEAAKALKKAGALEVVGLTLCNVRDKLIKSDKEGKLIDQMQS